MSKHNHGLVSPERSGDAEVYLLGEEIVQLEKYYIW